MMMALALSFAVWIYAQAQRSNESTVSNRRLDVRGLASDLVLYPSDLPAINIELFGPMEDLNKIDPTKVVPFIDLSNLQSGRHRVRVYLDRRPIPFGVEYDILRSYVTVNIERQVRQKRTVVVRTTGTTPAGFIVPKVEADPATVEVTGAKSDVDKVAEVRVTYDLSDADSGSINLPVELIDGDGQVLQSETVRADRSEVRVNAVVVPAPATKALPVQPTWKGALPVGLKVEKYEIDPPQVRVSAESTVLAKLATIETLPIDLSGIRSTRSIRTSLKLPKGITAVGSDSVSIKVFIAAAPQPKVEQPQGGKPSG